MCRCSDEVNPRAKPYKFSNQKLRDLGLEFTPVKQCLYETVKSLQEKGHLPVPPPPEDSVRIQAWSWSVMVHILNSEIWDRCVGICLYFFLFKPGDINPELCIGMEVVDPITVSHRWHKWNINYHPKKHIHTLDFLIFHGKIHVEGQSIMFFPTVQIFFLRSRPWNTWDSLPRFVCPRKHFPLFESMKLKTVSGHGSNPNLSNIPL